MLDNDGKGNRCDPFNDQDAGPFDFSDEDTTMVKCPLCSEDMVWGVSESDPTTSDWCQGCRDTAIAMIDDDHRTVEYGAIFRQLIMLHPPLKAYLQKMAQGLAEG